MKKTAISIGEVFLNHRTPPGHPERPERCMALLSGLAQRGFLDACEVVAPRNCGRSSLLLNHDPHYIDRVETGCKLGWNHIDCPDCPISDGSYEAACHAVGAVVAGVDAVFRGDFKNAFCAVRPPGHHAELAHAMGFCFFNNVAIAAKHLLREYALSRVLIFDFDVHHGNGTQHAFEEDGRVLFCSVHGDPSTLYPGTGFAHERGKGNGEGKILNIPLPAGTENEGYRRAIEEVFIPAADAWKPQFILISAGFDAHEDDPLGNQRLSSQSFAWMTSLCSQLAEAHCGGKLVSVMEGGYSLPALVDCVEAHLAALMD